MKMIFIFNSSTLGVCINIFYICDADKKESEES